MQAEAYKKRNWRSAFWWIFGLATCTLLCSWSFDLLTGSKTTPGARAKNGDWRPQWDAPQQRSTMLGSIEQPSHLLCAHAEQEPAAAPTLALPAGHVYHLPTLPTGEMLRHDVQTDPHRPPASLLIFAVGLSLKLSEAGDDPALAASMLEQLREVVEQHDQVPAVVAATCLDAARAILEQHPSLAPLAEEVEQAASQQAHRLAPPS